MDQNQSIPDQFTTPEHKILYWREERGWTFGYRYPDQRIWNFLVSEACVIQDIQLYSIRDYRGKKPLIFRRSDQKAHWVFAKTMTPILKPCILHNKHRNGSIHYILRFTTMWGGVESRVFYSLKDSMNELRYRYAKKEVAWSLVIDRS